MRHTKASSVLTAVLAALLAAGCSTGGGGTPTASPGTATRTTSPGTASWRPGEVRTEPDVCGMISAEVQRRLQVQQDQPCVWREDSGDERAHVERTLDVVDAVYQPAGTKPRLSATDQARAGYRNPPHGWLRPTRTLPVRGLGDEAKLMRTYDLSVKLRDVVLMARWRNVLVQIDAEEDSPLEWNRGRIPPVNDVEAAVLDAARDILSRLGAPATAAPPVLAYTPGEVRQVRDVCAVAAARARRLAPGVTRHDISLPGKVLGRGCSWSENEGEQPKLTVDAEAIAPSPTTGETATQIATTLFAQWKYKPLHGSQLGDEAKQDQDSFTFRSEQSRRSTVLVRWRNLLVYVDYERWHHPSQEAVNSEAIALARDVLSDQS